MKQTSMHPPLGYPGSEVVFIGDYKMNLWQENKITYHLKLHYFIPNI